MTKRMPVLFLSHGAPLLAVQDNEASLAWREIARSLPRPRAVLVASAHHIAPGPSLTSTATPETIHDFSGFPASLYAIRYAAPGAPQIAADMGNTLAQAGFSARLDARRGLDHGVWVPLRRLFPEADVPVISISVDPRQDARWHYQVGRALSGLRGQGVLIIGSGALTHNLGALDWRAASGPGSREARSFVDWVLPRLGRDPEAMLDWESAPFAQVNHPTPEHWLPLPFALGAAHDSAAPRVEAAVFEYGALAQHALQWD